MANVCNKYRLWLAGALLLLLGSYYVNSSLLFHQHTIDGQSVFHSHFSSKEHRSSDSSDGGHTFTAAKLIAALNNLAAQEQAPDNHVAECLWFTESIAKVGNTREKIAPIVSTRSLRAPPVYNI